MEIFGIFAPFAGFIVIVLALFLINWIRILSEYERGVVFRLGRVIDPPYGPGLIILLAPPFIDRMVKVDLRVTTLDVPPQDVITRDNVSIKLKAVVYYRILDPIKAITEVENFGFATTQMAQTMLRSIVGQAELDTILAEQAEISHQIQTILDSQTEPWGIKVTNVEIKNIDLPPDMQRAMARQAEAEREKRAKIIAAEGEFQASEKLVQAANMMSTNPMSLQMRYLQTMVEIGSEKNTTIFFPMPIDIIESFMKK
jgi:regulator of protease activity HflC (stomatin/prohibitin superfamily)